MKHDIRRWIVICVVPLLASCGTIDRINNNISANQKALEEQKKIIEEQKDYITHQNNRIALLENELDAFQNEMNPIVSFLDDKELIEKPGVKIIQGAVPVN
ncbi:MAG: hypothetical protein KZQ94_22580 [Candidatus Thiodiazotropha sp. (ex Troendleina suluensis)]|nr:hypothetical protein [Candidatus Thiodiazotropha sp. (ex Troendleina suluensis)]